MANSFNDDLSFSRGIRETTDMETLRAMIPGCLSVVKTGEDLDRLHIDYVANLRRGAVLHIDGKTRRAGASKFWKQRSPGRKGILDSEPDLAIEIWSVKKHRTGKDVPGWTFDESSDTDLILYTFDPSDTNEVVLLSFHLLRIAAIRNYKEWVRNFKITTQQTIDKRTGALLWESQCILVPALTIQNAIRCVERTRNPLGVSAVVPDALDRPMTADEIPWGMK